MKEDSEKVKEDYKVVNSSAEELKQAMQASPYKVRAFIFQDRF